MVLTLQTKIPAPEGACILVTNLCFNRENLNPDDKRSEDFSISFSYFLSLNFTLSKPEVSSDLNLYI